MVSVYMFHEVRKLKAEGKSQAAIAKALGIDPKTVAKYVRSNTPPKYKARAASTRADPFVQFEAKVRSWLVRTPTLTGQEIYELLIPEGYAGSERTVNRRMPHLQERESGERFFEQEYSPGEQSQFDFKEKVALPFVDGTKIVHLHFGTLPYSDTCLVRGYPFKNYECFMDGTHMFFESIGGMTENIRFDNLSPCVKKVLEGNRRLYTDDFNRATKYYGFGLLPCTPGKGSDKGDVERDIRTFSNRIKNRVQHEGLVFRDWDHLNDWLAQYMKERQKSESLFRLQEEQAVLKRLPPREDAILSRIEVGPSSSYGSVRVGKSTYSVPDAMIGIGLRIVIGAYDVRITPTQANSFVGPLVIHPRKPDGEHSLCLEHMLPSLIRKPHAMVRWAHRGVLFPSPICERFYSRLKKIEGYSAEREYLRTVNLLHHVALSEIIVAMELVLETQSLTLFDDVKTLLLGERRPATVIEITNRLNQNPISPELSQYDSLIPKQGVPSQ